MYGIKCAILCLPDLPTQLVVMTFVYSERKPKTSILLYKAAVIRASGFPVLWWCSVHNYCSADISETLNFIDEAFIIYLVFFFLYNENSICRCLFICSSSFHIHSGLDVPRIASASDKRRLLPSPRLVSRLVHEPDRSGQEVPELTNMIQQWGQFLDHDITGTPAHKGEGHLCTCDIGEALLRNIVRLQ